MWGSTHRGVVMQLAIRTGEWTGRQCACSKSANSAITWITLLCTTAQVWIGGSTDLVSLGSFALALHHVRGNENTIAMLPAMQDSGAVVIGRR